MPKTHCEASAATATGHCEEHSGPFPEDRTGHCNDHSGQLMWMRGIAALLVLSAGLLSYSVFWQAPSIKTEIAKEVARVDGEIKLVKKDVETLRCDLTDLKGRVEKLEK